MQEKEDTGTHETKSTDEQETSMESSEDVEIATEDPTLTELECAKKEADELLDRLQRLQAEFDNYRKRMDSRFAEAAKFASEGILLKMLEVYDNICRALETDFEKDPEAARRGIEAIEKQISKIFSQEHVKPIESLDKPFDPYYQHAVQKIHDNEQPDGQVVAEFQKGYMLKEKVLRPALVVVNRHEIPNIDEESTENGSSQEEGEPK
ncbi:MAG: nucleotide exchange factor GrpE [Candidatus Lokiarchaeota archaeon]|nr:nucleotide exchange factor GrpE [Candidatus Lokiarchaeota archaeon]